MASRVIYYRRNAESEWELRGVVSLKRGTREHEEATRLLSEIARREKTGRLAYLEVDAQVNSTWDLRHLIIRASFVNAACKAFLRDSWKLITQSGRKHWIPIDDRQQELFEKPKETLALRKDQD